MNQKYKKYIRVPLLFFCFVIPAEGARFAVLLKHSKCGGGFATMHSHDTHYELLCYKHPPAAIFLTALNIFLLNKLVK